MSTRFVVDAAVLGDQSTLRGDHAVRGRFPDVKRDLALKWLKAGRISIDGERATLQTRAVAGSVVDVDVDLSKGPGANSQGPRSQGAARPGEDSHRPGKPSPFILLFEAENLAVVDKAAGVAMHDGPGVGGEDGTDDPNDWPLARALEDVYEVEPGFKGPSFLGRLDRPTSGLVVAAFSADALRAVEPAWQSGAMRKIYVTLVHGVVGEVMDIDVPLAGRRPHQRGKGLVEPARTLVRPIFSAAGVSLVSCELFTGRTHQIRRHLKAAGHPLVGDPRYGRAKPTALDRDAGSLQLHAWLLLQSGDAAPILPRVLEAAWPAKLQQLLRTLGQDDARRLADETRRQLLATP